MNNSAATVIYTLTDEAPALATYSLLPIVQTFADAARIKVETRDISLAARILSQFNDLLPADQQTHDALEELGQLAKTPSANIIKLPNISASIPQLKAAIVELQALGYSIPDYPDNPQSSDEMDIRSRYDRVKGSAVNPVLREGNSDRRAPRSVKNYARANPHTMGVWSSESKTHVEHMLSDDFRANELSITADKADSLLIEHVDEDGRSTILKQNIEIEAREVVDASFMNLRALQSFFSEQIELCADQGLLLSLHLKATMMKVSDPIIFGQAVRVYFSTLFESHAESLDSADARPEDGLASILAAIETLPQNEQKAMHRSIKADYERGPALAMVNSDKGISNLHVPSDVIVDASMPAMIRASGKMWSPEGQLQDTKALIPDSSYAGIYQETINFCREHGAFDPATMGSVPNVGLMAKKAQEYGSHDKTFQIKTSGTVRVINKQGAVVLQHAVQAGDIWRMCTVKDAPVQDWVRLAVSRAQATGSPAIFWLDHTRSHDAQLIKKVKAYLQDHDTSDLNIQIMTPVAATRHSLERIREGKDTISVTGNVLRDYLTDLFPILELGTSAKMLSVVPLMQGGGLFETGAGGSAPKHVQQLIEENHLRWDSLGEFLALAVSFEHISQTCQLPQAQVLATSLDSATSRLLLDGKSPSRRVNELDNRGSHFYLALYWAQALAEQKEDESLAHQFMSLAEALSINESRIVDELNEAQGRSVDIGGYYNPDPAQCDAVMRPSSTLNRLLEEFRSALKSQNQLG